MIGGFFKATIKDDHIEAEISGLKLSELYAIRNALNSQIEECMEERNNDSRNKVQETN